MTVESIAHFWKIVKVEYKLALSAEFVYRWRVFIWVISDALQPILFALLWSAVAASGSNKFSQESIISYYFMVAIVSKLTQQDWSLQTVSNSIISGDFSKYLVRPFNYLAEMLGSSLAMRSLRIAMLLPLLAVGYYFLQDQLSYVILPATVFLFTVAVIVGFLISFLLGNIFALSAFFVKQILGMRALYVNLVSILSGEYIPLAILPAGLFFFLELLPFRYVLSFPIEIIMGSIHPDEIRRGFFIAIFWVFALYGIYKLIYKIAIQKYEAEGI